jgi:hypothetical protein
MPVMARPMIKAVDVGARAHTKEPTSKMNKAAKKTGFMGNSAYILPYSSWKQHDVSMKDEPYQPMSSSEWKSLVMAGTAVDMIARSLTVESARKERKGYTSA